MAKMEECVADAEKEEDAASARLTLLQNQRTKAMENQTLLKTRLDSLKGSMKKIPALKPQFDTMEQSKRSADKGIAKLEVQIKTAQTELKSVTAKKKEIEKQYALQQRESDKAEAELQAVLQSTAPCAASNAYECNLEAQGMFAKMCNAERVVTRASMIHAIKDDSVAAFLKLPRSIGDEDRREFETLFQQICREGTKTFVEDDFAAWCESRP